MLQVAAGAPLPAPRSVKVQAAWQICKTTVFAKGIYSVPFFVNHLAEQLVPGRLGGTNLVSKSHKAASISKTTSPSSTPREAVLELTVGRRMQAEIDFPGQSLGGRGGPGKTLRFFIAHPTLHVFSSGTGGSV